jgi:DNA gyrase inhibitor
MEVLSVRVVGPYAEQIPQGFKRLSAWLDERDFSVEKWLAFYWDDPGNTPPDALRADVAITSLQLHQMVPDADDLRKETIPGGLYAVLHTLVENGEFAKAWSDLYQSIEEAGYVPARGVCFERYLCDGRNGSWDIEIWQSVEAVDTAQ